MQFGEKLKELRIKKGLTQTAVANQLGVTVRTYISYEKENIRPRKMETYTKLAKILSCDKNYLLMEDSKYDTTLGNIGLLATGLGSSSPVLVSLALAGVAINLVTKGIEKKTAKLMNEEAKLGENDSIRDFITKQKRFRATAIGVLISELTHKGIVSHYGTKENKTDDDPDEYLDIVDNSIDKWWLYFWSKDDDSDILKKITIDDLSKALFCRFATVKSDSRTKISIVVDDMDLFNRLCVFKDKNSIRSNVSVVLIDMDSVEVKNEVFLAYYDDNTSQQVFKI